jgi:hypothetical protein
MADEVLSASSLQDALMKALILILGGLEGRSKDLNDLLKDLEGSGFTPGEIKAAIDLLVKRNLTALTVDPRRAYATRVQLASDASISLYERSNKLKAY